MFSQGRSKTSLLEEYTRGSGDPAITVAAQLRISNAFAKTWV